MIDDNGGFILWIQSAFGPLAGWVNGYNALFTGLINLPICVVLITDYINVYLQSHNTQLSWGAGCVRSVVQNHNTQPLTSVLLPASLSLAPTQHRFSIRIGVTVAVGLFNARGLGVVEKIETAMAFAVTVRVTSLPCPSTDVPSYPPLTRVASSPLPGRRCRSCSSCSICGAKIDTTCLRPSTHLRQQTSTGPPSSVR